MKIATVLGTRPEIIRLGRVIEKLDQLSEHVLIHTGQNYDANLSDLFFQELRVRKPDHFLGAQGASFGGRHGPARTLFRRKAPLTAFLHRATGDHTKTSDHSPRQPERKEAWTFPYFCVDLRAP